MAASTAVLTAVGVELLIAAGVALWIVSLIAAVTAVSTALLTATGIVSLTAEVTAALTASKTAFSMLTMISRVRGFQMLEAYAIDTRAAPLECVVVQKTETLVDVEQREFMRKE
jgi:hypothetical protein